MLSKKKRSSRSHAQPVPPFILGSAPLTASFMPPMNPTLSHAFSSQIQNSQMSSQSDPRLELLSARPRMPTGLEIMTENTYSGFIHAGSEQMVSGHRSHVNDHVPTAHDLGQRNLPLTGHIPILDEKSARHDFSQGQGNDVSHANGPREFTWVAENPAKPPKSLDKKRDTLMVGLTMEAGGSCIWCYKIKKGCGPEVPCEGCRENERDKHHCVRGGYSSLCLALTTKHGNHFKLYPEHFKQAQETLQQLEQELQPFSCPVVVQWVVCDRPYSDTLILATDQIDTHQVDDSLGRTLLDLAQKSFPVIQRPNVPAELSNCAHRVLSLLAVMKRLFNSVCYTEDVTIKTATMIVFHLMTVYTLELCKVSLQLADKLYHILSKKSSVTESKDFVIPAYIQTIEGIMSLQWPNSLMSDILRHVQPPAELRNLLELLRQLALDGETKSKSDSNESFDFNFPQFDVMIRCLYEMQKPFVPRGLTQVLRQAYAVNTLLGPQTIDPSILSPDVSRDGTIADHETSTALDSGYDPTIFSHGTETQNTDITYAHPDMPSFFESEYESTQYESTRATLEKSVEDLVYIGEIFN